MMRPAAEPETDWYASEQPTRVVLIAELQRIWRRVSTRPLLLIALTVLVTTGIVYKFATRPVTYEAQVVLALTEGALARESKGIPFFHLREYVNSILLPDNKLADVVEKHNLTRLRRKFGMQYAIDELRSIFEIEIWKNSFVYYDPVDEQHTQRSARIGITVIDSDPDRALDIARDLAGIVIETSALKRREFAAEISSQVAMLRKVTSERLTALAQAISEKDAAIAQARRLGRSAIAAALWNDLAVLEREQKHARKQMTDIANSPEALASEIAAAELDLSLAIVDEDRPERQDSSEFVLVMIAGVVGTGVLVAVALVLGAFDSRVHDTDDVARLGLPVLGHVPGFAGDNVGSMRTRSVAHARVPSFRRWRSHR
jgi:hypothetical protein